jgi:SM-20-related protein
MPGPGAFRHLGLFVENDFVNSAFCTRILTQIRAAESISGTIFGDDPTNETVDESRRKVLRAKMEKEAVTRTQELLQSLKPKLEEHFLESLSGFEMPSFLRYEEGAFYTPHLDTGGEDNVLKRRISVVIFLNAASQCQEPDCYGGGSLTFYGLLNQPPWDKCPLPLEAKPGLLIAFRSNTLHEVQPVTFGQRFTIVTWFHS